MGNLAAPLNTLRTASLEPLSRAANRILVVEDDPAVQKALRRLFETEGYAVETQSDGKSAVDSFHASAASRCSARLASTQGFRPGCVQGNQGDFADGCQ